MPRKTQQWTPLEGAVDHDSFKQSIIPGKRGRAIAIKKPSGSAIDNASDRTANGYGTGEPTVFSSNDDHVNIGETHHLNGSEADLEESLQVQIEVEKDDAAGKAGKKQPSILSTSSSQYTTCLRDLPFNGPTLNTIPVHIPSSSNHLCHLSRQGRPEEDASKPDLSSSKTTDGSPLHSTLDIYAPKYVPSWQRLVNESPSVPVYSPRLQHIDFDVYKSTFVSQAFLPRLPRIELPPTEPCHIHHHVLDSREYEPYWQERLHNEFAAQRRQNFTFDLFDHPIFPHDTTQYLYKVKIPGVREYTPRIDLGDIVIVRPLQPVLQGNIAQQAQTWSQKRDGLAPGFSGTEHHAVVWSIMRRDEVVILKLGQTLHGDQRQLRCNIIIPLQAHKNLPAWRSINLAACIMKDTMRMLWLTSMLFPRPEDSVQQDALSKGTSNLFWSDKSLNFEQQRAVEAVVDNNYGTLPYLISGPPGTGKTKTLVEAAIQLLNKADNSNIAPHILVCAPSDAAADTLLIRLSALLPPKQLFRLNNWTRLPGEVPGEVRSFCYIDETTDLHSIPPFEQMMSFQVVVTSCRDASMLLDAGLSNGALMTMAVSLLQTIAPGVQLRHHAFHWTALLLDEAAQATEPDVLIPITVIQPPLVSGKPSYPQVVMAGDEFQLGPRLVSSTILASTNEFTTRSQFPTPGLEISLFQRLFERPIYCNHPLSRAHGLRPLTRAMLPMPRPAFANLIRNYRSHPAILSTSSHLFYADTLIPERPDVEASILAWSKWPSRHKATWPVMFIQNKSEDSVENVTEGDGTGAGSLINRGEAHIALETVHDLLVHVNDHHHKHSRFVHNGVFPSQPLQQDDIIVLAPFRAQVAHLRSIFRAANLGSVRIGPLEAFQGLESRVVVICTTRTRLASNAKHHPGRFVMDDKARGLGVIDEPKRFNVAMTRAKEGLIVIGSAECLGMTGDHCWREFLKFVERNGLGIGTMPVGGLGIGGRARGGMSEKGKLERALLWAERLERESEQTGIDSEEQLNGHRNVNHVGHSAPEAKQTFKFRLRGRMVDLDEKMWEMQASAPEETENNDYQDYKHDDDDDSHDHNDEMKTEETNGQVSPIPAHQKGQVHNTSVWVDRYKSLKYG